MASKARIVKRSTPNPRIITKESAIRASKKRTKTSKARVVRKRKR